MYLDKQKVAFHALWWSSKSMNCWFNAVTLLLIPLPRHALQWITDLALPLFLGTSPLIIWPPRRLALLVISSLRVRYWNIYEPADLKEASLRYFGLSIFSPFHFKGLQPLLPSLFRSAGVSNSTIIFQSKVNSRLCKDTWVQNGQLRSDDIAEMLWIVSKSLF